MLSRRLFQELETLCVGSDFCVHYWLSLVFRSPSVHEGLGNFVTAWQSAIRIAADLAKESAAALSWIEPVLNRLDQTTRC
jgi:hypothetical protein